VSHELRTPITTILGNAEVLDKRRDHLSADERDGALRDIAEEADRLFRIIENMLVLAPLDQGRELEMEPILVRRVVESVVVEHRRRFPYRRVNLEAVGALTPVGAERGYVEQIVRNLLSNAEKYSPPEEAIDVQIVRDGDEMRVSVMDRGPGIAPEEAEAVFTAFYRSKGTALRAPGVGIGLTVCKRLVEAQGGRIWAAHRTAGGATIGFSLPVWHEEAT
jgi:K+-sensing histidine kinase KdpD